MDWKKRVMIILGLLLIAFAIAYVWLVLYFMLGEDLVIGLSVNQTSFHITNSESAGVTARLDSRAQLFCSTLCDFEMYDPQGSLQHQENFTTHSGQQISRNLTLYPKEIGSGQVVYSLRTTCHNQKSILCPSSGVVQRDVVLLTLNYDLPKDAIEMKSSLDSTLPEYLNYLSSIDENIIGVNALLSGSSVHAGQVLADLATLQDRFSGKKLIVEAAITEYSKQDYNASMQKLLGISKQDLISDLNQSEDLKDETMQLPVHHNSLRDRLYASRAANVLLISQYAFLSDDPYAGPQIRSRADAVNIAVDSYISSSYSRYPDLERIIESTENISSFNESLQDRADAVVVVGNALLKSILDAQCALNTSSNASSSCMNESYDGIEKLCTRIGSVDVFIASNYSISGNSSGNSTDNSINGTDSSYLAGNQAINYSSLQQFNSTYCNVHSGIVFINDSALEPVPLFVWQDVSSGINVSLPTNLAQCCVFGQCKDCCTSEECNDDPSTYPVVFVHGHSFNGVSTPEYSLGGYFSNIQQSLEKDGYIDAGIVTPSSSLNDVSYGEWGLSGRPVTARVTYYYNFYKSGDQYILVPQKSENIETYAIRLNEMINLIKHHTGKKKVDIVAHSMGGLVVRRYIELFGENSVDKVVLVATPNNGTFGRVKSLCPVFGESKECSDMASGSVFLQKLNDPSLQPKNISFTTIAGSGCDVSGYDGDGVVTIQSVALPFAKNYVVNGSCTDLLGSDLHSELLNIDEHPQVYSIIKRSLEAK